MADSFQTRFVHEWGPTGGEPKLRITVENMDMDYANSVDMQGLALDALRAMHDWAKANAETKLV